MLSRFANIKYTAEIVATFSARKERRILITPPPPLPSVLSALARPNQTLSKALKRVAEAVLAGPERILEMSITELGESSLTSAATVTRFCRAIGFGSFRAFKVALALELGSVGREAFGQRINTKGRELPEVILQAAHLASAFVDLERLHDVARILISCRRLEIYCVPELTSVGQQIGMRLRLESINCFVWHGVTFSPPENSKAGDAILIVGGDGSDEAAIALVARSAANGLTTIVVTANQQSALSEAAEICLQYTAPSTMSAPALMVSEWILLELLCETVREIRESS